MRHLYAQASLTPDEAGFLTVARQWHPGSSLYGDYWVDRPSLLMSIFWLGDDLGGTVGLRLGCFTVVAVGATAHSVSGLRAGRWAVVIAAAALATPLTGSSPVNGELLAAPFVATGVPLVTLALRHRNVLIVVSLMAGAMALAAAVVLVKQSMLDVLVFAAAAALLSRRAGGVARYGYRISAAGVVEHMTLSGRLGRLEQLAGVELPIVAPGPAIGAFNGQVAHPTDTVVSSFGDADFVASTGLAPPRAYLWSLPARTLDPEFAQLGALLEGPQAPTWYVVRRPKTLAELQSSAAGAPLRGRYQLVSALSGGEIYLRDDAVRDKPAPDGDCTQPLVGPVEPGSRAEQEPRTGNVRPASNVHSDQTNQL